MSRLYKKTAVRKEITKYWEKLKTKKNWKKFNKKISIQTKLKLN